MDREKSIPLNISVNGHRVKAWYVGQPVVCDICRGGGHIAQNCPERGRCRNSCELGHLACDCTNRPNAWQTVNQDADTPSVASDPTPAEAAGASGAGSPSAGPAFSSSVSTGIGADLVTGSLSWGDHMDLADNELSPFSASESDSSLGSHVSPSLSMPSCGNKERDSNQMNDMDSYDMNIIDSDGSDKSISNMVMRNLNSSQNDYSNSQSILSDRNKSNVACVSNVPSGSSGGDSGPAKDAGVTMDASFLGKRAILEVVTDGASLMVMVLLQLPRKVLEVGLRRRPQLRLRKAHLSPRRRAHLSLSSSSRRSR